MPLLYLLLLPFVVGCVSTGNPWAKFRAPLGAEPQSIGAYNGGCLKGAEALPVKGSGYFVLEPQLARHFGHPSLIAYLTSLGKKLEAKKLGSLVIGDLSQPRGGPMPEGHRSHQTGLDVDIHYETVRGESDLAAFEGHSVLHQKKRALSSEYWMENQQRVLELAADDDRVDRIFVHPLIKKKLCEEHGGAGWIRKLRPWWGHEDHFHVRLLCPAGSSLCEKMDEITSNGCGEELTWWMSQKPLARSPAPSPQRSPALAEQCLEILRLP